MVPLIKSVALMRRFIRLNNKQHENVKIMELGYRNQSLVQTNKKTN